MSGELDYTQNPWRLRLRWILVYLLLIALAVIIGYFTYGRIQTYTLPNGGVELHVPYTRYLVGENISFTVTNNFDSSIYVVNGCPAEPLSVYKYINKTWVRIHDKTNIKNCNNQDRSVEIAPHSNLTATFDDWPHLFSSPGTYRIAMQVEYYDTVPYQDFQVVAKPKPKPQPAASSLPIPTTQNSSNTNSSTTTNSETEEHEGESALNPHTYTVYVNSSGNYSVSNLSLHVGDSVRFVYQTPYHDEVRTYFTPINGTSTNVSSVTVDAEYTSRTRQFTKEGTWRFRAADHSGNTGTVTVND